MRHAPISDEEMIGHAAGGRNRDENGAVSAEESIPVTLRRYDAKGNVVLERSAVVHFSAKIEEPKGD